MVRLATIGKYVSSEGSQVQGAHRLHLLDGQMEERFGGTRDIERRSVMDRERLGGFVRQH